MICYPSTDKVTPLIVAGPQRCGTRFVMNVLNSVPGFTINGEIPPSIMNRVISVVEKCDLKYLNDNRKNVGKNWNLTKRDFMFAAWANIGKDKRKEGGEKCFYYGYKTPFHEKYFDFYNGFFQPIRPKYICCVRCFNDHYFSVKARWPEKSISSVTKRYVRSLRRIRYMKQQRPDDVLLFFLDDYKEVGFQYFRDRIFEPLGLNRLGDAQNKAGKGPANSAAQMGVRKRQHLTGMEKIYLKVFKQSFLEFDALHRDFG